jgi:hypothetical protein
MNFGIVDRKQLRASRGHKQKDKEPRDERYARKIRAILDRVRFLGQFACGSALVAQYSQPPRIQVIHVHHPCGTSPQWHDLYHPCLSTLSHQMTAQTKTLGSVLHRALDVLHLRTKMV